MRNFYFINALEQDGKKQLISEMRNTLRAKGIQDIDINSNSLIIDIGGNEKVSKMVHTNESVNLEDAYFWFRSNRGNRRMISVIATYLNSLNIDFSDYIKRFYKKMHSKPMQAIRLSAVGVRIPRTILMTKDSLLSNTEYINMNMNFPCVLKVDGSQGRNVWKVSSFNEVEEIVMIQDKKRTEVFLIQEIVAGASFDVRILFFKDIFIGAIKRSGDGFLNNYAQGGEVSQYEPTAEDLRVCATVRSVSMLDYLGVDIMYNSDGEPVVIEIQDGPGSDAMRLAHGGINIGDLIINRLT